jgi:NADP-dependent 3-hydroxy acid dehydrogenase YdfG
VAAFATRGHTVVGCGRGEASIRTLRDQFGSPHRFARVDVTDSAAVEVWSREVVAEYGPPDLLVNNAALMNAPAPLWEVPVDEFSLLLDVNVKGVFHVVRAFAPAMVARSSGVIVNLSSGWGRSTAPDVAPIIDTDMLRQAWADGAGRYPKPAAWAEKAAPFLLNIGAQENGRPLTVA